MRVFESTQLIGNTPLVDLSALLGDSQVKLFGKLEGNNPGGSVKDRPAFWMISEAEKRGELTKETTLIEPTSGNTGIGLAMMAAMKGYRIELVMPADATRERVLGMESYGAKVILTPSELGMEGAIDYARAKVAEGGYKMLDQFGNPDNWRAHEATTGPEIWRDTDGLITHFVSSMGTTGTIMGCSRYLKAAAAEVKREVTIVGVQPEGKSKIPGIRRWPEAYLPKIYEPARIDRTEEVSTAQATAMTHRLAQTIGVSVGMSSGGATYAAVRLAHTLETGLIVVILCDRGDRYLSSGLFEKAAV